jgi:uncharacterized protein YfaS (alpha-2-macroglobulin family)
VSAATAKYDIGDRVRLIVKVRNMDGTPEVPTIPPQCDVRMPNGSVVALTGVAIPSSAAEYQTELLIGQSGTYRYRWGVTGNVQAAEEGEFTVRSRRVPAP